MNVDSLSEVRCDTEHINLPVVYVGGFLSTPLVCWYLKRSFERAGYEFHPVTFARMATGDMVDMAQELQSQVEALAGQYLRVHLVCHSAGGLVARYYIQTLSRSAAVASVVFLGTPHQGTLAAYAGFGAKACRQMVPRSRFMEEIESCSLGRILTNRSLSIYSSHDLLVLPAESGRLAGARNLMLKGPLGHGLPLDPRAFAAALSFIEEMT